MYKTDINNNIYYYDNFSRLHREDGPAIIIDNGDKCWYFENKQHRTDGPAVIVGKSKYYYIMGKEYSYEYWLVIKDFSLLW